MFEHSEYHIYTTASGISKRYVHLTDDILEEAKTLAETSYDTVRDGWNHVHRLKVEDNVYLAVGDGLHRSPSLQTSGYEGWVTARAGKFEERIFFEDMIFYQCSKREDSEFAPEWDIGDIRGWVNPDHLDQFDEELSAYLEETDRKI